MDFNQLLARMQELDGVKSEAPVEQSTQECGMNEMPPMMSPDMPAAEPKEKASMSININARGEAIDDVMALIKKMGGEDKPEINMPTMSMIPPMGMDEPEGPPMPKPINKLIPDFDGDNDDMPGGEKDTMDLPKDHDKDHIMIKSLDKDGDMDHDMDDHDMEKDDDKEDKKDKEEAYANEPDEEYKDIDYITQKTAGGMNRRKGTHPKVAGGDNPMQKVGEADLRASIKQQLLKALEEHKGA